MDNNFSKVKNYLLDLEYSITKEDETQGTFVINAVDKGIVNMVIAIADPIVIIEQQLFAVKGDKPEIYKQLLQKNRDIIQGGLVLDDKNDVIFRDTLQVETLDINELEGSINSLSIFLSEYSAKIIEFSK